MGAEAGGGLVLSWGLSWKSKKMFLFLPYPEKINFTYPSSLENGGSRRNGAQKLGIESQFPGTNNLTSVWHIDAFHGSSSGLLKASRQAIRVPVKETEAQRLQKQLHVAELGLQLEL